MKHFEWSVEKNELLKNERNISFEEIVIAIEEGKILEVLVHPNKDRYPKQKIIILDINGYAYLVPYVEDKTKIFLKTIIPSRKATSTYLIKRR